MTSAPLLLRVLLIVGVLVSALVAQPPAVALDGIRALQARLAASSKAGTLAAALPSAATRYADLLTQLRDSAASTRSADLALAYIELSRCADVVFPGAVETARLLDELDGVLRSRPGLPHGRCQLLNRQTRIEMDAGVARTQLDAWDQLVRDFVGPKRFWIGCEAARSFIANCGRPLRAEQLLTQLLDEIERVPEWDEAERLALVRDPDLWITDPERPRAASRSDTVGQLLVLRIYAREQIGSLLPAVEDLQAAQVHLVAAENEHRIINGEQSLASIWLQLGCYDLAITTAEAVRQRYQRRSDHNGELAMRKVKAQGYAGRGEWLKAAQLLAGIVDEPHVVGETNGDALTSYMESLLHVQPSPQGRAAFDEQLRRIRHYCGTDRSQLLLWRAELLLTERTIRDGDSAGARRILDAAKEPLELHRHLPLQVRRLVLSGDCFLANDPLRALGEYETAAKLLGEAVASERLWRLEGATVQFAQQFHAIVSGAHAAVSALLAVDPQREPWIGRLYVLVQQFHGFESLCRLLVDRGALLPDSPQERRELEPLLHAIREAEVAYEALRSAIGAMDLERKRRLAEAEGRIRDGEQRFKLARAKFMVVPTVEPSAALQVQQGLAEGELLVECVETPQGAFAFALTRTGCELHPLPCDDDWRDAVRRLRAWDPRDARRDVTEIPELKDCSARLLATDGWLAKVLARPGITRLLWSPEGSFSCVPLHALPYQGKPLLATLSITHAISGSWLQQQRGRARSPRAASEMRLLALGSPRYDAAAVQDLVLRSLVGGGAFPRLPATAGEVLRVAGWFADDACRVQLGERLANNPDAWDGVVAGPRLRVFLGAAASESALESALVEDDFDVLHFACHGEGNHEAPFRSFLALSPDGDAAHPGAPSLLRLPELSRLRGDFELVTLSACQTSVGAEQGHDGVAGLAWAAQLAGARRVLATLWSVPDAATGELVVEFYRRWLQDGMSCSDALAATQRAAIGKLPVRAWAPFVLWGEPR